MATGWRAPSNAVSIADRRIGPDELTERVSAFASRLGEASMLAIEATPTLDTVVAVLAALQTGVVAVPISPDAGPRERDHALGDSGADAIVDHQGLRALPGRRDDPPPPGTALLLYTSGTTGLPKGVPISVDAMTACLDALADAWAWTPDDTLVHGLPLHHVHGLVLGVLGPIHVGSALVHTGRPTAQAYARAHGSLYFGVPTVWHRVAQDPDSASALRHARLLVSGSAALPRPVFDALTDLTGHAPVERYGMTETLITVSARADQPRIPGTVGLALHGVQTSIVDDDGELVDRDGLSIGHLLVRGPGVTAGYLHRPEATAAAFTDDGWFRTGDIATIDANGVHRIVGRASTDLIKSGGFRIGAGEVEDVLLGHPAVHEVAVVGVPDDDLGQRLVAYVVAADVTEAVLIEHVASQLAWHKRPREVVFVEELPRTALGKVEKARLLDR